MFIKLFSKKRFLNAIAAATLGLHFIMPATASTFGEVMITPSNVQTFIGSTTYFTPPASPTDIWELYGSSSKTIEVLEIYVDYITTTAPTANHQFFLRRRSSANTSGTAVNTTVAKADSNNSATTVNTIRHYTANPTTGTDAGQLAALVIPARAPQNALGAFSNQSTCLYRANNAGQAITLRGASEGLVVNLGSTSLTGGSPQVQVTVVYREKSP